MFKKIKSWLFPTTDYVFDIDSVIEVKAPVKKTVKKAPAKKVAKKAPVKKKAVAKKVAKKAPAKKTAKKK
jgi:hypothetical protein